MSSTQLAAATGSLGGSTVARIEHATQFAPGHGDLLAELLTLAPRGLAHGYLPARGLFVHTVRRAQQGHDGLELAGVNLRYSAMTALGLSTLTVAAQQEVLVGKDAVTLAARTASAALESGDPGAWALSLWAATELMAPVPAQLVERVRDLADTDGPIETVVAAWVLTALSRSSHGRDRDRAAALAKRLMASQPGPGVFGHMIPSAGLPRTRRHVGCFADQIYPIQALSRWAVAGAEPAALASAERAAARIVAEQGPEGQWWWHYDVRTGGVVEGYPVYSVHQHAMAPMALNELREVGGTDHSAAVMAGLAWVTDHPERPDVVLVDREDAMIWRSIRRREPAKASRAVKAALTSLHPAAPTSVLDRLARPLDVDWECRPYELGWLLYAWQSTRSATTTPALTTQDKAHPQKPSQSIENGAGR